MELGGGDKKKSFQSGYNYCYDFNKSAIITHTRSSHQPHSVNDENILCLVCMCLVVAVSLHSCAALLSLRVYELTSTSSVGTAALQHCSRWDTLVCRITAGVCDCVRHNQDEEPQLR